MYRYIFYYITHKSDHFKSICWLFWNFLWSLDGCGWWTYSSTFGSEEFLCGTKLTIISYCPTPICCFPQCWVSSPMFIHVSDPRTSHHSK